MHSIDVAEKTNRKNIRTWSLGFGGLLCFLIAAYFMISAGFALLNFERYGAAAPQFIRYILIPAIIMLAFILIPMMLNREKTLLVGIYSTSVLAALFLVEAYLTAQVLPILSGSLGQLNEDQRRQIESDETMIRGFTLRRLNVLAETNSLEDTKLSGFPGAKTLLCSIPEVGMRVYEADRYGFNNPDDVYDRNADIAVVGDSFVEGFCLPEGEDLTAELRNRGTNAISLGIRGNGPLLELATLGRFGPTLRPKHVVMAFFEGNDWKNLNFELGEPWLREALDPNANFGSVLPASTRTEEKSWNLIQDLTQKPITKFELLRRSSLLRNFFALHRVGLPIGLVYPKVPPAIPDYETLLRRSKSIVESWGGTFSILYIPQTGRFGSVLPTGFVFDQLREQVLEAADAAGVDVIDLVPAFNAEDNPKRFYAVDAHFSEDGADFVADLLTERFSKKP